MSAWPSQIARPLSTWRRLLGTQRVVGIGVVPLLLSGLLLVRVLTDDVAPPDSRQSGSLGLSAAIAALAILIAAGLLARRRQGLLGGALALSWVGVWTAVALRTHGASGETLREGVRETSVVAVALIVWNARETFGAGAVARLLQLLAAAPALLALYQLATGAGMDIAGEIRANGTLAHPNSAAMFFAIATTVSVWWWLQGSRRTLDGALTVLFAAALLATFSIDGLLSLAAALGALGALWSGPARLRLVPFAVAAAVLVVFFASPLGAQRVSEESQLAQRENANTSLAWRFHKWRLLLPEWERSPVLGRGLGSTLTSRAVLGDQYSGKPPHNEYVRYLVETGVAGLATLLGALALALRALLRMRFARLGGDAPDAAAPASALALAVLFGCLVNALADNTFIDTPTCYVTALLLMTVLALPTSVRRGRLA